MNVYTTPLKEQSFMRVSNIPHSHDMIKSFPIGYTITAVLPNRRARRNRSESYNNRSITNSRGVNTRLHWVQLITNHLKNTFKSIFHKNIK